jgi:hypothetical protein
MHDLGLLDEKAVYDNFRGEGYDDTHAKNMTLFYLKYNEMNDKDLSMSQVKDAYKSDIITKEQAKTALIKLQYTESQALFILEYVDYQELIDIQKLRIKSLAKMYKDSAYDINKTRNMLISLGVETKWIEVYLTQWEEEKIQAEKVPDKAELISWLSGGQIDKGTFISYMRKLHYSDTTIGLYMKITTAG